MRVWRPSAAVRGVPPPRGHFWRFGLPFLLFIVFGAWGWSKMLQQSLDATDKKRTTRRDLLYGRSVPDDTWTHPQPNKQQQSQQHQQPQPGRPLQPAVQDSARPLTLEEEFERMQKQGLWLDDYELKRIPRPPGEENRTSH